MILGLQIIAILFSFSMIYFALLHFRRQEINVIEFYSWILIWTVTVFVVFFPQILRNYSEAFFITRLFDLMIVGGFILVIIMVARTYVATRRFERKLEDIVRKGALNSLENTGKKSKSPRLK